MNNSRNLNYFIYLSALMFSVIFIIMGISTNNESDKFAINSVQAAQVESSEQAPSLNEDILNFQQKYLSSTFYPRYELWIKEKENNEVIDSSTQNDNEKTDINKDESTKVAEEDESIAVGNIITDKKYKVTAFYLNLRQEPNANSKILRVLEKDDVIEIKHESEGNVWLELKSGGFVHSKYVEVVDDKQIIETEIEKTVNESNKEKGSKVEVLSYNNRSSNEVEIVNPVEHGVNTKSNLTIEQISKILENTNFVGIEEAIIETELNENVNALFIIAVARLESGNGKSKLAVNKNNLFGLNASDSNPYGNAYAFDSMADSVLAFGDIINKRYIEKGYTTISEINKKYASDENWKNKVSNIIKRDLEKLKKENYL